MVQSFEFKQCITLLKSTGKKACTLRELRERIAGASDESILHHTYQYFLKGHILEYTNDFAQWAGSSLEERALAEQLSNIDPYDYDNVGNVRSKFLETLDQYLSTFPEPRPVIPGDEFFFNETVMLIYPSGIRVKNLAEFLMAIKYVDKSSLYYHFYEARQRLGSNHDDFTVWFETVLAKKDLVYAIRAIDPFMHTLEGIREQITRIVEAEVQHDMAFAGVES
ncbi:MAG: DUF5752 family protein [Nitrospirota bacterium]